MEAVRIEHPLEPIYAVDSRVLVLGTMPSPKSREPLGIEGRAAFLYAHGIALWDVLSSCAIVGASDASIVDPVANDLSRIAEAAPLEAVFTTGSKATALYRRFGAPQLPGLAHTGLPSTSPANARMRLDDLVKAYLSIRETLERRDGGGR